MATQSPTNLNPALLAEATNLAKGGIVGNVGTVAVQASLSDDQSVLALSEKAARRSGNSSEPEKINPATVTRTNGNEDLRVRIKVPFDYATSPFTTGYKNALGTDKINGIIFPYTPSITFEHSSEYVTQSPLHSNFSLNFYKNSKVSDINITGIFTVQNYKDATNYLSTIYLLRVLTKMRFGGDDPLRGSPPPICRLYAYGTFMLDNVPIAISSFRNELTSDVDYYHLNHPTFGKASVPTKSTIQVSCKPMYSRREMLNATVPNILAVRDQRASGIL